MDGIIASWTCKAEEYENDVITAHCTLGSSSLLLIGLETGRCIEENKSVSHNPEATHVLP